LKDQRAPTGTAPTRPAPAARTAPEAGVLWKQKAAEPGAHNGVTAFCGAGRPELRDKRPRVSFPISVPVTRRQRFEKRHSCNVATRCSRRDGRPHTIIARVAVTALKEERGYLYLLSTGGCCQWLGCNYFPSACSTPRPASPHLCNQTFPLPSIVLLLLW